VWGEVDHELNYYEPSASLAWIDPKPSVALTIAPSQLRR
jgi:hypothetical protein